MSEEKRIAWHPAFVEAIQAELEGYKDVLEFQAEYPLTTEPLRIDVLIVKKRPDAIIEKSIARMRKISWKCCARSRRAEKKRV